MAMSAKAAAANQAKRRKPRKLGGGGIKRNGEVGGFMLMLIAWLVSSVMWHLRRNDCAAYRQRLLGGCAIG
jgi:hypothetical protein